MHPSSLKWFARCSLSSKRVVMMHTKVIATYYPIVYLSIDVTSYLNIRECDVFLVKTIGHFWVQKTLTFKMRPNAQPFLWKWVLFAWEWTIISIWKAEHLISFSYRGPRELGNGLFLLSDNLPAERAPDCRPRVAGSIPGQTHYLSEFLKHC